MIDFCVSYRADCSDVDKPGEEPVHNGLTPFGKVRLTAILDLLPFIWLRWKLPGLVDPFFAPLFCAVPFYESPPFVTFYVRVALFSDPRNDTVIGSNVA